MIIASPKSSPSDFGDAPTTTTDYINSRGSGLVTNYTGLLGNNYNFPDYTFDGSVVPAGIPGSFRVDGYYPGLAKTQEFFAVDPNLTFELSGYVKSEVVTPSGFSHTHYIGLEATDLDGHIIGSHHHMVYGGKDARTFLTQPLNPGDTQIHVDDASLFDHGQSLWYRRGVIIFNYTNTLGFQYKYYSRNVYANLWTNPAAIDTANNVINLADPWTGVACQAGDEIANANRGGSYKYMLAAPFRASSNNWFYITRVIGGIDTTGTNRVYAFSPGTAFIRFFTLPNYSNRVGGSSPDYPDSGASHPVYFSGFGCNLRSDIYKDQQPDGSFLFFQAKPTSLTAGASTDLVQILGTSVKELTS